MKYDISYYAPQAGESRDATVDKLRRIGLAESGAAGTVSFTTSVATLLGTSPNYWGKLVRKIVAPNTGATITNLRTVDPTNGNVTTTASVTLGANQTLTGWIVDAAVNNASTAFLMDPSDLVAGVPVFSLEVAPIMGSISSSVPGTMERGGGYVAGIIGDRSFKAVPDDMYYLFFRVLTSHPRRFTWPANWAADMEYYRTAQWRNFDVDISCGGWRSTGDGSPASIWDVAQDLQGGLTGRAMVAAADIHATPGGQTCQFRVRVGAAGACNGNYIKYYTDKIVSSNSITFPSS